MTRPPPPRASVLLLAAFVACAAARPAARAGVPRPPAVPADSLAMLAALERDVLAELNRARTDPRAYAAMLDSMVPWYDGTLYRRPGATIVFETSEGAAAVREAADVLRRMPVLPPFERAEGLARAARDHVRDQGPHGRMGHTGSDGSTTAMRVERYGRWNFVLSENIAYGPLDARGMVIGLIVDDGVPDRGHRLNIYDARVKTAGVACGGHRTYGRMCVIVHAGGYADGAAAASASKRGG